MVSEAFCSIGALGGLPQPCEFVAPSPACSWDARGALTMCCSACEDFAIRWRTRQSGGGAAMTFEEILDQAVAMLQRRGRVTYRALTLQSSLDDDHLEALEDELL